MPRRLAPLCLVFSLLFVPSAPGVQEASPEVWRGSVDLSAEGQPALEFTVRFVRDAEDAISATISIPSQGAVDLPLADVVYTDDELAFTLVTTPSAVFRADRDGDRAVGTLNQGVEFPLALERAPEGEDSGPPRPQHPRPPFPYAAEEVAYDNPADGNRLAGTLTLPVGEGPWPAAILITGSGLQDRDETIFGHKPFWVIADHLTRAGIAVLRVDDRGVGGSSGPVEGATSDSFAGDVLAGVRFLAARPEVDGGRIGLIGHSEGGLIAPMVAVEAPEEVAWIVLLAGTGIPGSELMPLQLGAILTAAGVPDDSVRRQTEIQREMIAQILENAPESEIRAQVAALVQEQSGGIEGAEAARQRAVDQTLAQVTSAWYRRFLALDPRDVLRQVRVPVLALNGTLDLQVPADPNLREIEGALRAGGNHRVTVRSLEGLNHLFQHAATGLVNEYGRIEETFSPLALEVMTDWIRERVAVE